VALTAVEQWSDRGIATNDDGVVEMTRGWLISETNAAAADPREPAVLAAVPVNRYDSHPDNSLAIARNIDAKPTKAPKLWRATVRYSTAPFPAKNGDVPSVINPATATRPTDAQNNTAEAQLRFPEFTFGRKEIKEAAEADAAGVPLVNAAGDPLEGIEVDRSRLTIGIKFYSINLTTAHILNYWNSINNAAWKGFGARTLKVTEFTYRSVYETLKNGSTFFLASMYEANVTLEYNPYTWRLRVLNAGKRQKRTVGGSTVVENIVDSAGQPVSEPVPLTALGAVLAPGGTPNYLYFDMENERDFTGLIV